MQPPPDNVLVLLGAAWAVVLMVAAAWVGTRYDRLVDDLRRIKEGEG